MKQKLRIQGGDKKKKRVQRQGTIPIPIPFFPIPAHFFPQQTMAVDNNPLVAASPWSMWDSPASLRGGMGNSQSMPEANVVTVCGDRLWQALC